MQVAVQRPVGDEGVRVVGRADDHGVEVLLIEALPPVDVGLGLGEPLQGVGKALFVHVAQRDHVLVGQRVVVRQAAAPDADQGDVELVAGGVLARAGAAGQEQQSGPGGGGGLQELATIHGGFSWFLAFPIRTLLGYAPNSNSPHANKGERESPVAVTIFHGDAAGIRRS